MAIDVTTRDASSLGDAELGEIAEFALSRGTGFDIGLLSKLRDEWVLCSDVREDGALRAVTLCSLERIGGTPCILLGVALTAPGPQEKDYLFELLAECYRKALLAFPDEDVLVGVRLASPSGYDVFTGLEDVVPRPDHKPSGEERAWARRLAKRFGVETHLDDRSFIVRGDGEPTAHLVYGDTAFRSEEGYGVHFSEVEADRFDTLVAFGWAMAERLADGSLPG
ncbi:MAG: hypothetical protein ACP5PJ_06545 [Acidimicrobiales bacterium]